MHLDAPTDRGFSGDQHSVAQQFTEPLPSPPHLSLGDHGPLFTAVETEAQREESLVRPGPDPSRGRLLLPRSVS